VGDREGHPVLQPRPRGAVGGHVQQGQVGIDVAYPEEFGAAGAYPFGRTFSVEERECAEALCAPNDTARGPPDVGRKEASVKATGARLQFFDPLEVRVGTPLVRNRGPLRGVATTHSPG